MDVGTVTKLVGRLAFQSCVAARCFWSLVKEKDAHKEMEELRKSVEANTTAINSLCQHLGGKSNE